MKKIIFMCFVIFLLLFGVICLANATPTLFTDRTAFTSQGVIAENYGFEDITVTISYFPGQPWDTHGVTYNSTSNIIFGPSSTVYVPLSNILANNNWTPLTGSINNPYTMFGFDLGIIVGNFGTAGKLDLSITTNLATYAYNGLVVPNVNTKVMDFYGFVAGAGEFFTNFNIAIEPYSGSFPYYGPAIDNVTLGTAGAVPIPGAVWLLGSGLLGLGGWRRFRKS